MSNSKTHEELVLEALQDLKTDSKETRSCVDKLDKKLDLHIQKTEYELKSINELDQKQNESLAQHIEGVRSVKKLIQQHEEKDDKMFTEFMNRFEKIEAPSNFKIWWDFSLKGVGVTASIAGLAWLLMRIFGA